MREITRLAENPYGVVFWGLLAAALFGGLMVVSGHFLAHENTWKDGLCALGMTIGALGAGIACLAAIIGCMMAQLGNDSEGRSQ